MAVLRRSLAQGASSARTWATILLAAVQLALLLSTAWDKSDTADEIRYLSSGFAVQTGGSYRDLCEAPVLPKRAFAIALLALDPSLREGAFSQWQDAMPFLLDGRSPEEVRRLFFRARLATILLTVAAGVWLARVGRRLGPGVGVAAQALWVFSPTVLANGSLATLDVWAASMASLTVLAGVRFAERPTALRAAMVGAAVGCMAATKVPALLLVPVGAVALLVLGPPRWRRGDLPWGLVGVAGVAGFLVLWASYGFSVGGVRTEDPCSFLASRGPSGVVPFPAWWEGLLFQLRHAVEGHANYLLGQVGSDGWWSFYLVAVVLKTTLALQALVVLRVVDTAVLLRRGEREGARVDVALLSFPLAFFLMMTLGRHQPNIGFLLPAFPLAMLWVARGVRTSARAFPRWGRRTFLVLLVLSGVESVAVHPHHLMFFNAWAGGPEGGPRYLVSRDDWGQDKRRLAAWQAARGVDTLFYAAYGPNPETWGIRFEPVPCEPTAGVYALHAIEVHRPRFALRPGCVDWLTVEPPDERLGYSIYIYEVGPDRLPRLARRARDPSVEPFWSSAE